MHIIVADRYRSSTVLDEISSGLARMGCTYAMLETKIYDPDICHFLIVLHNQCALLDFEYP